MARCSKCRRAIDMKAVVCPHCGYDFPPPAPPREEYHPLFVVYAAVSALAVVGKILWDIFVRAS